jgi:anti-sigma factor RsiW
MSTPERMPCQDFVELVTEYLEDTLDPVTRQRFDEHIALCDGCETYLAQMRSTAVAAGRITEEHLSEPARTHLLEAFRHWTAD